MPQKVLSGLVELPRSGKSRIKKWESESLALGQYLAKVAEIASFEQMHMHAYLAKDDVCLDLYLSKVGFEEEDRRSFEEVFSTVEIIDVRDTE